jgi:response regulator RpfG family c-di-GMP phosphodiesterase
MNNIDTSNNYLVWNDVLRTKLVEKTQDSLNLNRMLSEQNKLIKSLTALHLQILETAHLVTRYEEVTASFVEKTGVDSEAIIRQKLADALYANGQGPCAQMVLQVKL